MATATAARRTSRFTPEDATTSVREVLRIADTLSDAELACLGAIIAGESAWSMAADLEGTGHTVEVMSSLEAAGYVARWGLSEYHALTLTPWAAEALGVVIVEGMADEPKWGRAPRDARKRGLSPDESKACKVAREWRGILGGIMLPELIASPNLGPADEAVFHELLTDAVSGEPITLFGRTIPVDARMKAAAKRPKAKPKAKPKQPRPAAFGKWGRPLAVAG